MGLRPGEARALEISKYRDGWLIVDRAMKGHGPNAPIRGTKTGKAKRLPVSEELQTWIAKHVDPAGRLRGTPLFVNPRRGTRYSHSALRDIWKRATTAVGIEGVGLYEGTKHTMATDAIPRRAPTAGSPRARRRALDATLRATLRRGTRDRAPTAGDTEVCR